MIPEELFSKYEKDIATQGIFLNPDHEFTIDLIKGILVNRKRYGEDYCPCRLVSGQASIDAEIICPCIFRDSDIDQFGQCFCSLFVDQGWIDKGGEEEQIPDQWDPDRIDVSNENLSGSPEHAHELNNITVNGITCWYCTVCGYMAIRNSPPPVCPICKVKKDRFRSIRLGVVD